MDYNKHEEIPIEISNQIECIVKENALKLSEQGFSLDSIKVYFQTAINIGIYKAEIDIAMKL